MNIVKDGINKKYLFGSIDSEIYKDSLNIAYGVDRNFLFGAAISMQSISMHNPAMAVIFHIFTDYIDDDYLHRVSLYAEKNKNVQVIVYVVSEIFINIFPSLKQWSYATFFRFIAFQYLSQSVEKVLYLDADVICKGNLSELLNINFTNDHFAAVIKDVPFMQDKPAKRLNVPGLPGKYFNAGVVFLKLAAWEENNFFNKAIAMLTSDPNHQKYKCLDQDILNILFFGHCIHISGDYDCFYGVDYELKNKTNEDFKDTITEETKLIHYVGVTKPWHNWTHYPCQQYFNDAWHKSQWSDVPLLPPRGEKQYKVKYQHALKNNHWFSAILYYIKFYILKTTRKIIKR